MGRVPKESNLIGGPWDNTFLNVVEQACELAMFRLFSGVRDEAIRQALAQGFSAAVDWCFSEQFETDIAQAALAIGLEPHEAATGATRKAR